MRHPGQVWARLKARVAFLNTSRKPNVFLELVSGLRGKPVEMWFMWLMQLLQQDKLVIMDYH